MSESDGIRVRSVCLMEGNLGQIPRCGDAEMLVLSRKMSQSIQIDSMIQITVVSISRGRVKLGISAPDNVRIMRHELIDRIPIPTVPPEKSLPQDAKVL
jgi:carbon storage regulator